MLEITSESHLDHGLSDDAIVWIAAKFMDKNEFFIETLTLPPSMPKLMTGLHGPIMGDPPVPESECEYMIRGTRKWPSRMCNRPMRETSLVTVIAGPHGDKPCILYTSYGGLPAPREPGDTSLKPEERAESAAFWAVHALSK